ncbi:histidine kinase [Streptacidiphilus sp. EB129]|uniref:sensor histidine kinase n=1 Tax=Streptacidiphilus sp. EB129 TaxID=3156262 RepID=UPI003511E783
MSGSTTPVPATLGIPSWTGRRIATAVRAPVLAAVALTGSALLLAAPAVVAAVLFLTTSTTPIPGRSTVWLLLLLLLVPALPLAVLGTRASAWLTRLLAARWCGVTIATPYRPVPQGGPVGGPAFRLRRWTRWLLTDPATWRDLLWSGLNGLVIAMAAALPAALGLAVLGIAEKHRAAQPGLIPPTAPPLPPGGIGSGNKYAFSHDITHWLAVPSHQIGVTATLTAVLGAAALGLLVGPRLLTGYGTAARALLGPTRQAELALRVRHLAATRTDTIDSGAAELRRIERDLHDGAQARLVAMGMTISAADQLVESNPQAARALLAEAMAASVKALAELRDLVRGIHPPVLADRGLADAVHALTLDLPLPTRFSGELPGRAPAAVESAAYFAVSELLANAVKHAGADRIWIEIGHTDGTLRVTVTDDGRGGADPADGSGLRGLERRLAAFDGVLAVSSPPGGPTLVNLEIPCVLSSPKTSSC